MDDLSWCCRAGQHVVMADGAYQINPNAVMSITADVSSLASHTSSLTSDLMSMSLDATAFAGIGSAVASANSALQNQILQNLTALWRRLGRCGRQRQYVTAVARRPEVAAPQGGSGQLGATARPVCGEIMPGHRP